MTNYLNFVKTTTTNNNNNGVMNKYCVLQTVLFPAINEIQAQLFLPPSSSSYEMQQALTCS